ncbi:MAG: hypothetical protein UIT70_00830 [Clostridia bacterium]|nr:hypothetical protein [Clostridia bacterium]
MNEKIKKVKEDIETFLMENMEHQNKHIDYILVDQETNETYVLASDGADEAIEFNPLSKNYKEGFQYVPEWDYNFDYYIYNYLEEGKQIAYMTDDVHYSIWNSIHELYPEDIDYKEGVQNYLQYCADNGITKEYLDKKTGLNTPDIMQYFEGLAFGETMRYKGYICVADDINLDNNKEKLVQIYENQQNYINGENIETISLNTIGLKQNIKDYIDDVYIKDRNIESERAYFTFILGYDLLNDMLSKSDTTECDINYDFCNLIANRFLQSEGYKNTKYSAYEMLQEWLSDNQEIIQSEYLCYSHKDNKCILETGKRNSDKVALVEHQFKDGKKEYIVAFHYEVDDKRVNWGYGYYYGNDLKRAKKDFEKVKIGGNLADTFEEKKSKKNKERER